MKYLIIIMALIVILAGGGVFFGLRLVDMTEQIGELKVNYSTLQASHNTLQSSYNTLDANYRTTLNNYNLLDANYNMLQSNFSSLQTDFQSLKADFDALESDYHSLESDYDTLQSEHMKLEGKYTTMEINYNKLQLENRDLERLISEYEQVPHSYYSSGGFSHHSNTFDELCYFLTLEFALPRGYEENIFDCSESSAYLEWALENAGFDAEIAVGRTPWDPTSGYHAWVMAYPTGYNVVIEATALTGEYNWVYLFAGRIPGIVYGDDSLIPGWENYYYGYDNKFRNIYQAIRNWDSGVEWNWWEGFWGFK